MSKREKRILLWYKRDLRINDHAPLVEALQVGKEKHIPVVALYCFEPSVITAPDFSDFHRQYLTDSLIDLKNSLESMGIELFIFERNISDVMKYILEIYDIEQIFSHEETGNNITYQRDILMGKYLRSKHILWKEFPTNGVVRRLKSRDDWSRIWNSRMGLGILPIPEWQQKYPTGLKWDSWQGFMTHNPRIQKWGEREWQKVLNTFLTSRGRGYMGGMSRPIEWQEASSRLSPYLAYGCLSLRQVVQATGARIDDLKGKWDIKFLRSLIAFQSRLHWQSHFIQKLESEPRFEYENALALYDTIRREYDERIMTAIENAKTGIPFIDGVIRQLQATGWVNFRARATLVSFVCCTCMQPWQGRFAHWLARLFTDYEPGIHYSQLQMQSGTMGINTIRIYNPVKQLHDKDTEGKFVATWIPELAKLPKYLQAEPWRISYMESIQYDFVLGRDYSEPIIDIETSNREARKVLYTFKKSLHPDDKKALLQKHGSRKRPAQKKAPKKDMGKWGGENLSLFE